MAVPTTPENLPQNRTGLPNRNGVCFVAPLSLTGTGLYFKGKRKSRIRGGMETEMDAVTPKTKAGKSKNGQDMEAKREAYYARISKMDLAPLWKVLKDIIPAQPKTVCAPAIWHFKDVKASIHEAGGADLRRGSAAPRAGARKPELCAASRASPSRSTPAISSSCRARLRRHTAIRPRRSASSSTAAGPTPRSMAKRPSCSRATS